MKYAGFLLIPKNIEKFQFRATAAMIPPDLHVLSAWAWQSMSNEKRPTADGRDSIHESSVALAVSRVVYFSKRGFQFSL